MTLSSNRALSRLIALCLLIAMIAAFGFGLGVPLAHEYRLVIAEIGQSRLVLDDYQRIGLREGSLRTNIERLERDRLDEEILLPRGSDSSATAAVQDRVQSIIGGAGAWLTSVQPLPATLDDGHQRVGLRVAFTSDIDALRDILYNLEQGRPVMILDRVFIHARTSRAVGTAFPLEVQLDVFAFKPDNI